MNKLNLHKHSPSVSASSGCQAPRRMTDTLTTRTSFSSKTVDSLAKDCLQSPSQSSYAQQRRQQFTRESPQTGRSRKSHIDSAGIASRPFASFVQVALVYSSNDPISFICAFYGCLLAGIVPLPIDVPLARRVRRRVARNKENKHTQIPVLSFA